MKKLFSVVLSGLLVTTAGVSFSGCGGDATEKIDPNKTQVYISVLECGIGREFADSLKEKYESTHPDVQILVEERGGEADGPQVLSTIKDDKYDIYFMYNFYLTDYISIKNQTSEYLADITDIVTEKGNDGLSVEDKMYDSYKTYHNVGADNSAKYFTLPWYSAYFGTVYDVDLFDEMGYYFDENGEIIGREGTLIEENGVRKFKEKDSGTLHSLGVGPDGVAGSVDDGLSHTWEDFKNLLTYMSGNDDICPFTWTSYEGYVQEYLSSIWANYEGYDNYSILQTFDGIYKATGQEDLKIDKTNGYQVAFQNGKKSALTFAEYIIRNNMYSPNAINTSQTHLKAQTEYLKSVKSSKAKRIAFLMEGSWWEKEAVATFKEMESTYGSEYAYKTRRFGYMPFPQFIGSTDVPDQVNTKSVIASGAVENQCPTVAISKNSKHLDLAKDILKFAYSDEMNADFTMQSGVMRPFAYSMTDGQLNNLSYFQKNMWDIAHSEYVEKVCGYNRTDCIVESKSFIESICKFDSVIEIIGSNKQTNPLETFSIYPNITVDDYFAGINNIGTGRDLKTLADVWDAKFNK